MAEDVEREKHIQARAEAGEYRRREHWIFDADADVLFLCAALAQARQLRCSQCGQLYWEQACGPTHALIAHERGFDDAAAAQREQDAQVLDERAEAAEVDSKNTSLLNGYRSMRCHEAAAYRMGAAAIRAQSEG